MAQQKRKWSQEITEHDNPEGLQEGVFTLKDPKKIAEALKKSASEKHGSSSYQSAMSMLDFYINRAGEKLSGQQKQVLEQTKDELRKLYNRD